MVYVITICLCIKLWNNLFLMKWVFLFYKIYLQTSLYYVIMVTLLFLIRIIISLILEKSIVFLNGIGNISFEDTKKIIRERLELNYDDVKLDITWRYLVGEFQYFFVPIVWNVDFRNISWMDVFLFHLPLLEDF